MDGFVGASSRTELVLAAVRLSSRLKEGFHAFIPTPPSSLHPSYAPGLLLRSLTSPPTSRMLLLLL